MVEEMYTFNHISRVASGFSLSDPKETITLQILFPCTTYQHQGNQGQIHQFRYLGLGHNNNFSQGQNWL